jgi:heat shock protein HslJ
MTNHKQLFPSILLLAAGLLLVACGDAATADLEGSHWVLIEMNGAEVIAEGEQELTLNFEDGQVSGYSGCNQFGGEYSANMESGSLEIGPLTSTLMACMDDDMMAREGEYLSALQTAESYALEGDRLSIQTADGNLRFQRLAGTAKSN